MLREAHLLLLPGTKGQKKPKRRTICGESRIQWRRDIWSTGHTTAIISTQYITLTKNQNYRIKPINKKKKIAIFYCIFSSIITASVLLTSHGGVLLWANLLHSMLLLLKVLSRIHLTHIARRRRRRHNRWRHLEGLRDTKASRQYVNSNLFPRYYYYYSAVTKLRKSKNYSVYSSLSLKFRKHFK